MSHGIGRNFIEKTKYLYLEMSDQMKGISQPPLELPHRSEGMVMDLPEPEGIRTRKLDLRDAIEARMSVRDYSDEPVSIDELAYLFWCTQGVKEVIPGEATLRIVPSAGARHAIETYVLINNVENLYKGLYRFLPVENQLAGIESEPDMADRIVGACLGQELVKTSAVTFIWTAVIYRMTWRYGERGYRYIFLDAGHVCQNLYLSAESIGCGVCALAAFDDDKMNRLIGIDGKELFVIYMAAVGKKL